VSGRSRNCQCNTILIIKVKKAKECRAMEAEVDVGQIGLSGNFSQSRYRSGYKYKPPSPDSTSARPRGGAAVTEGTRWTTMMRTTMMMTV
jgi:hypothetical protein